MKLHVQFLSVCVVAMSAPISCSLISADELFFPAAQIEQGKGSIGVYLNSSLEKLSLQVRNREEIKVGGSSYFSSVSNDIETKGRGKSVAAKVIINPWSGFYYWLKAGSGSYDLEIPSVTVNNTLGCQEHGAIIGIGVRKLILPETIVTPALSVDFGVNYRKFIMRSFQSDGAAKSAISNILEIADIQTALLISKKYGHIEPYGALLVGRTYQALKDTATLGLVDGSKDTAAIVAGTRIYLYQHESLVIEGQISDGASLTTGWNIQF